MKPKSAIALVLVLGGLSAGAYFLGARSRNEEIRTLKDSKATLEFRNEELYKSFTHYHGMSWETLEKMDPITRKHMILQIWYSSQEGGNIFLGRDMGHEWGPRWNRRSPILILEEQTKVMTEFLTELRKLEEASPSPPRYPTEKHIDPVDESRIEWENFIELGNDANVRRVWYGKSRGSGDWMAYEFEKGVYAPDEELRRRIADHNKSENSDTGTDDGDPFSGGE